MSEKNKCGTRFVNSVFEADKCQDELEGVNRFLVKFPETMELNEWWISDFNKHKYDLIEKKWISPLKLTIRSFFSSNDKNWHPHMRDYELIENLISFNKTKPKHITFEALDSNGCTISKTKYTYPVFRNIEFEETDNSKKGLEKITVEMDFDTVEEIEI